MIEAREHGFVRQAIDRWRQNDNIKILGDGDQHRLSIISFIVTRQDKHLHYSFIVALLNDLFGIQARGGCSCAGPYGHWLLDIDQQASQAYTEAMNDGNTMLRPGWTRVNFNYFIEPEVFEYIVSAVELIADHGWRLLPYYKFDEQKAVWQYQGRPMRLPIRLKGFLDCAASTPKVAPLSSLQGFSAEARTLLCTPPMQAETYSIDPNDCSEALRWFLLPQEVNVDC